MGEGSHSEDQTPTSLTQLAMVGEDSYHKIGPVYHQMREDISPEVYLEKRRPPSRGLILTTGLLSVLLSVGQGLLSAVQVEPLEQQYLRPSKRSELSQCFPAASAAAAPCQRRSPRSRVTS